MPTISVKKELLFKALGQTFTDEEFGFLCFDYGLELDDVTSERQMLQKEQGAVVGKDVSDEVIYRIDIPANRYDLLCLEGLVTALLVFQNKIPYPNYRVQLPANPKNLQLLKILPNTAKIRPFAVSAVLRDVKFTEDSYASFIDLQDKLHQNVARKRTLVAIGTHDLDTIQGPFSYDALPPTDIKFKPLNQTKELTAPEIMELYSTHAQLKQYLPIIRGSPVYPVIKDANNVVLSMPPIINGDHSKITLNTKNVFIEVTATDLHKAQIVLDTLVTAFSCYCKDQYKIEPVEVEWVGGSKHRTPELKSRKEIINTKKVNKFVGMSLSPGDLASMLTKMCLSAKTAGGGSDVVVTVPPTRHDILHPVDIYEDAAIAFGYNNIPKTIPKTSTVAKQQPANKLTDHLRIQISQAGFTEILSFTLCSRDDISSKLRKPFEKCNAVEIGNPKTLEFQVVRTTLIPGLLKSVSFNKNAALPIRLFEVSDISFLDRDAECGARNERRLAAVYYDKKAGFEVIHGLLDRIMQTLGVPWSKDDGYYIYGTDDDTYFPKRCAEIRLKGVSIGSLGTLHPDVIKAFDLSLPCSVLEFNLEPFV
ncbi:Phenylalanyl-tRNA synthetase beta [Nesidiocoris tenuis]|uniref:Phenylalanine--tRNA ligase beta subunit n=1 Tax=Nesidiocoris tenuis TaxID=355587 RepID=A0ABN7AJT7_9HEMI|nr:Phenylalanyl-tRNA synthetase beta [Nesidiocoris tenuis]